MLVKTCDAIDILELNKRKEYTLTATCILENVLTNPKLNAQTVKLWQFLFNKAKFHSNLEVKICYNTLAKNLGRSHRSISRYVKTLVQEGYLLIDENFSKDGSQRSNTLYVRVPSVVVEEVKNKKDRVINKDYFSSNNELVAGTNELESTPDTDSSVNVPSVISNKTCVEVNYNTNLSSNINHIKTYSANDFSIRLPIMKDDLSNYPSQINQHDNFVVGEDDKIDVHKDNIKKDILINNNVVVHSFRIKTKLLDSENRHPTESLVNLNRDADAKSIISVVHKHDDAGGQIDKLSCSVLRETSTDGNNNNQEDDIDEQKIKDLNAKINSLYIKMGGANSTEKLTIFEEIRRLQASVTTMTVIINQKKNTLKSSDYFVGTTEKSTVTPCYFQNGDRVLSEQNMSRITRGIKSFVSDHGERNRLCDEIIYAIRFGSLRVAQTGELLSIPHAISIALKLLREKRWETPVPLKNNATSSFLRYSNG